MRRALVLALAPAIAALAAPAFAQGESVRSLMQTARGQSSEGNMTGALESLRKARSLAPNSEEVLSAFAQVAIAARQPVAAVGALEPLTRMCPSVAQYHFMLGVAFLQAGAIPAASDALQTAQRAAPDNPRVLVALGLALNIRKQHAEARSYLARGLELDPENVDALAAVAEAEDALGDANAEAHAARAVARQPDHAMANYALGLIRMKQTRYAEARDALLRAVAADPRLARAHYQLSLAYARLGDEASAQKHVELYQQQMRQTEVELKKLPR